MTSMTNASDELLFARLGANDPDFNLRRDSAFIIRRKETGDTVFASMIEPHGNYSPVTELAANSTSNIANAEVVHDDENYTAVVIEDKNGQSSIFLLSNLQSSDSASHQLVIDGKHYRWVGPYRYANVN